MLSLQHLLWLIEGDGSGFEKVSAKCLHRSRRAGDAFAENLHSSKFVEVVFENKTRSCQKHHIRQAILLEFFLKAKTSAFLDLNKFVQIVFSDLFRVPETYFFLFGVFHPTHEIITKIGILANVIEVFRLRKAMREMA